jgi:hypothetical protein
MDGEELRNEGTAVVLDNEGEEYKTEYRRRVRNQKGEFLFESIRLGLERDGFRPHHPNVCGAFASRFVMDGVVVRVGQRKSRDPRSHARKQPLFVLAGGAA